MAKTHYTNQQLVGTTPSAPNHLVTMEWVENYVIGKVKLPVRAVSATNISGSYAAGSAPLPVTKGTFTLGMTGVLTIDGVALAVGDRVLLTGQTAATQNGIYEVTDAGSVSTNAALIRAEDWDTNDQIFTGVRVNVQEGTLYARTTWSMVTSGTLTIDSTAISFVQIASSAGASKYAASITGDNSRTAFTIQHDLGTTDIAVSVYNLATKAEVGTDVTIDDADNVVIGFDTAPTPAQSFRVVVIG